MKSTLKAGDGRLCALVHRQRLFSFIILNSVEMMKPCLVYMCLMLSYVLKKINKWLYKYVCNVFFFFFLVFICSLYSFFWSLCVLFSIFKEKHELQPNDLAISKSFESSSRMFVYRKDLTDSLVRMCILYFQFFMCLTPDQGLPIHLRVCFQYMTYFSVP